MVDLEKDDPVKKPEKKVHFEPPPSVVIDAKIDDQTDQVTSEVVQTTEVVEPTLTITPDLDLEVEVDLTGSGQPEPKVEIGPELTPELEAEVTEQEEDPQPEVVTPTNDDLAEVTKMVIEVAMKAT